MEVQLTPDLQVKLEQMANATGRPQTEVVLDAMTGYFEGIEQTRVVLDRRYDEIKNGEVQLIDGEAAFAELRAKGKARRKQPA